MLIKSLKPDCALHDALREAASKTEAKAKVRTVDDALDLFKRR
ncbi:hypothetical protein [Nocardioides sp. WS12]|nr:hypothetical protein [Nocardioides sp. WS12]